MGRLNLRFDSHTLGNLAKNLAPVAGTVVGGPAGLALAGGLGAAGELGRGKNIGQALRAGASSAGQAGIGQGARGLLAGARGASDVAQVPAEGSGFGGATTTVGQGVNGAYGAPVTTGLPSVPDVPGILQGARSKVGGVLDFAEAHPNAAGAALTAAGNIATSGSQNRLLKAQTDALEAQTREAEYERKRKQDADIANQPLRDQLWGQVLAGLGQPVGR